MKIKKFVGASMSECLLKVKKELGENAVILDSRKVARGGPFSFLLQDMIEVLASTEDRQTQTLRGVQGQTRVSVLPAGAEGSWSQMAAATSGNPPLGGADSARAMASAGTSVSPGEFALISEDLRGLKETVAQMADHLKFRQLPSLPAELERLHRLLLENGVADEVANTLTQALTLQLTGAEFEDSQLLQRALYERIGKLVRVQAAGGTDKHALGTDKSVCPTRERGRARVIALIGPTGVGKTTTLAKLATHPALFGRQRVALVSADTYRIAAVEQLKTFASIANLPMEAVYRPADIRRALDRFRDRDVVLIDTAGRSQNDRGQLNDLVAFMEFAQPDETYLVLSISTRLEDQLDVIQKFEAAQPRRLIFTKLDETTSYGMILNVCSTARPGGTPGLPYGISPLKWPVSLLTCGQNVPDDIIAPSQGQLIRLLADRSYFRQELLGVRSNDKLV